MKVIFCLLMLSLAINNAYSSTSLMEIFESYKDKILEYPLVQKILGSNVSDDLSMPELPKLIDNPLSLKFGDIDDPLKRQMTDEEKINYANRFIHEVYQAVRNSKPKEYEYDKWMNILVQGAGREGVYSALIYDRKYALLEHSQKIERIREKTINFTIHYYKKFLGIKIKSSNLKKLNVFSMKRIATEKSLQMIDTLYQKKKENVYTWYANFSSELARKYRKLWRVKFRQKSSAQEHYRWAAFAGEQFIKAEVIIKLNKLYNYLEGS